MLKDFQFLGRCSLYLKPSYFVSQELSWLFSKISAHYLEYQKIPEIATLDYEISKFDVVERILYETCIKDVLNCLYSDTDYLRKELTGFIRRAIFSETYIQTTNLYNQERHESAYELTREKIGELYGVNFEKDDILDFTNFDEFLLRAKNISKRRVPTGIPTFDKAMFGGLPRQTFTTILGVSNVGKTSFFINLAYHIIWAGYKVLYIYHEGNDDQVYGRFFSRFSKIPYEKLFDPNYKFEDKDEVYRKDYALKLLKENLHAKKMKKFRTPVEEVIDYCSIKKQEFDFDVVIDDYGQKLSLKSKYQEKRFVHQEIYQGLKSISDSLDVVSITAAQGNRDAMKRTRKNNDILRMTDISECFGIVQDADQVITISKSIQDTRDDKIVFCLDKQRDTKANLAVRYQCDWSYYNMFGPELAYEEIEVEQGEEQKLKKLVQTRIENPYEEVDPKYDSRPGGEIMDEILDIK